MASATTTLPPSIRNESDGWPQERSSALPIDRWDWGLETISAMGATHPIFENNSMYSRMDRLSYLITDLEYPLLFNG
jgi:hypothetical protein